jgi:ubiquinone/menaquinone biosynthesis C-methylase UbiE
MSDSSDFSFDDDSVAGAYADVLVPILFEPWARGLIELNHAWAGCHVLDLATGTGIVAQLLASKVGTSGAVVGMDMNQEMLNAATIRAESFQNLTFVLSPAEQLDCQDASFDHVVCQQGFQFFSDREASSREIYRVLRGGGSVMLSVWRPVVECGFFGAICDSLEAVDEHGIAKAMRVPFDFLPVSELVSPFESAGFAEVEVHIEQRDFVMGGGVEHAIKAAYSTPIGPKLRALPEDTQARFLEAFRARVSSLGGDEITMGKMAADVLVAKK